MAQQATRLQGTTGSQTEGLDRNEALLALYPMVERIAHKAAATYGLPAGVDADDLVSCGVLGLAEAWERFDAERGVAFEAFAIPRIKGAVIDAIRASDWVPRKARQRARLTGEPVAVLVSIDSERNTEDGDHSISDRLVDTTAIEPGADLLAGEGRREMMAAMNRLPDRERTIISAHYFERVALQDIAKSFGVTESRVSQLHTRALRMLRAALESEQTDTAA
jgi:RNA polymerase sigma factor for flagellar operon FliA